MFKIKVNVDRIILTRSKHDTEAINDILIKLHCKKISSNKYRLKFTSLFICINECDNEIIFDIYSQGTWGQIVPKGKKFFRVLDKDITTDFVSKLLFHLKNIFEHSNIEHKIVKVKTISHQIAILLDFIISILIVLVIILVFKIL